jgi:hypothetical protein
MLSQPKATMNNKVITAGTTEYSANDGMRQPNLGTHEETKAETINSPGQTNQKS